MEGKAVKLQRVTLALIATTIMLFSCISLSFASGSILVKVFDTKNRPLPEAKITLSQQDKLISDMPIFTDARGEAIFPILPVGSNYQLLVEYRGYAPQIVSDMRVTGGNQPLAITIKMMPEIKEVVESVASRGIVRTEEAQTSTIFSDNFMNNLPVAGREYQSVIVRSPGIQDEDQDGNPTVKGSRERDFKALIDGVSNVDPLTGTFMSDVNPDAIEEIEVITGGAGAEFSRAQGGFAKITTKQGSNNLSGVFNFYYRSRMLDGNGASDFSEDLYSDYKWINPSFSMSGALIKDKLFWAISHEYFDIGYPINALTGPLIITNERSRHFDKLTWQVTGKNKLIFQVSSDPNKMGNLGIDTLTLPDSGYNLESGGPTYVVTWQAPISPQLLVTSMVAYSDTKINIIPMTYKKQNNCLYGEWNEYFVPGSTTTTCFDELTGETSGSFWYTWKDKRQRMTVRSDAEYFVEKFWGMSHKLKAGFIVEDEKYSRDVTQRPYLSYWLMQESGLTEPGEQPGVQVYGLANAYRFIPPSDRAKATGSSFGLYIEDSMKPLKTLTVSFGLRLDKDVLDAPGFHPFDPIAQKDAFEEKLKEVGYAYLGQGYTDAEYRKYAAEYFLYEAFGPFTGYENEYYICEVIGDCSRTLLVNYRWQNIRKSEDFQIDNLNFAPRFGFSWDPWNRGRSKFFGTFGRYYDKLFLAVPLWEQSPVMYQAAYALWGFGLNYQDAKENAFIWSMYNTSGVSIHTLDRNIRTPYSDEITLGFETEIATETSLKLMVTKREYKDQLQDIDINHYAGDYGPTGKCDILTGGMQLGYEPDGTLDDCTGIYVYGGNTGPPLWAPIYHFLPDGIPDLFVANPLFNEIFYIGNFNKAVYKDFEIELMKRRHHHWELQASYVYSVSKGDAEDYAQGLGDDPTTLEDEKGYLSTDQRHVLKINTTFEIPLWNAKAGMLVTWESGLPYSRITRGLFLDANSPYLGSDWATKIRSRTIYDSHERNNLRNESYWTFDVHVQKDMGIKKMMISIFADVFNLLNDDRQRIYGILNDIPYGERRFGRQFQVGFKAKF